MTFFQLQRFFRIKYSKLGLLLSFILASFFSSNGWDKKAAYEFLKNRLNDGTYTCLCSTDVSLADAKSTIPTEIFSSAVVLDLLADLELDNGTIQNIINKFQLAREPSGLYRFFIRSGILPNDIDITSLVYIAMSKSNKVDKSLMKSVVNQIIKNTDANGLLETYLDQKRHGRIDPVVCANALYLINMCEMRINVIKTEEYLHSILINNCYMDELIYYSSPMTFLFMMSRLLDFPFYEKRFESILKQKVIAMINKEHSVLDTAMLIICAKRLGLVCDEVIRKLDEQQLSDGGWQEWSYFKNGKSKKNYASTISESAIGSQYFGGREIVTAFAIKALTMESAKSPI